MSKEEKIIAYTPWVTFIWAIALLTTIMLASIGVSMSAKTDASSALQQGQSDKEQSETNMIWIRESLTRIEKKIDVK